MTLNHDRAPTIGSLFTGYGGLEMGVQAAIGGTVVWHSEIARRLAFANFGSMMQHLYRHKRKDVAHRILCRRDLVSNHVNLAGRQGRS